MRRSPSRRHAARRRTVLLGTLASLSLGACRQAPRVAAGDAEPTLLLPGSESLLPTTRLTDTLAYQVLRDPRPGETGIQSVATGRIETKLVVVDGAETVMLTLASGAGKGAFHDTSIVMRRGLAPVTEAWRSGDKRIRYAYAGPSVRRTVITPDSGVSVREHRFAVPVFHFNELTLLARSLPLRTGFRAIVPLYSEGDDALERDTLSVLGRDSAGSTMFVSPMPSSLPRTESMQRLGGSCASTSSPGSGRGITGG